jgi:hypothetical protein
MRNLFIVLALLLLQLSAARAELNIGFGFSAPGISIGINLPAYPQFVPVPGYPVYYDPELDSNYFFYDGMYWVLEDDEWYASSWYNGPWYMVERDEVPLYVLRVPVRYYRSPPSYFRGWRDDAAPRWSDHWGREWNERHQDWDKWNRHDVPKRAPLPTYQRNYSGDRYPTQREQHSIEAKTYKYNPREPVTQQYQQQRRTPAPQEQRNEKQPAERGRDRGNDRVIDRGADRVTDRDNARGNERANERVIDRGTDRVNERGNDRGNDRSNNRGNDRDH